MRLRSENSTVRTSRKHEKRCTPYPVSLYLCICARWTEPKWLVSPVKPGIPRCRAKTRWDETYGRRKDYMKGEQDWGVAPAGGQREEGRQSEKTGGLQGSLVRDQFTQDNVNRKPKLPCALHAPRRGTHSVLQCSLRAAWIRQDFGVSGRSVQSGNKRAVGWAFRSEWWVCIATKSSIFLKLAFFILWSSKL